MSGKIVKFLSNPKKTNMTAEELHSLFLNSGKTLGSVESFTGGKFAREMTRIPGASNFFKGSLVTYANEEKERLLQIDPARIETYGVVSQEIGGDMAMHGKFILNVDYCISFTGNAGPSAMEGKPVGEVYIGVSAYSTTQVFKYQLNGTREQIIDQALDIGYQHLKLMLETFK